MLLLLTAVVLTQCLSDWLGYSYKFTIRDLQFEKQPKRPLMLKRSGPSEGAEESRLQPLAVARGSATHSKR